MLALRVSSVVAVAGLSLLAAACGGAKPPSVASNSPPSQDQLQESLLKYAQCMRSHGVSDFPDPSGGGFSISGVDRSSPVFTTAQATCQKDLPGGGPGSGPPASAQALTHMDRVAACMRRHGVPDFPIRRRTGRRPRRQVA